MTEFISAQAPKVYQKQKFKEFQKQKIIKGKNNTTKLNF